MIILRSKIFAVPTGGLGASPSTTPVQQAQIAQAGAIQQKHQQAQPAPETQEPSLQDLQLEQMKMQRALMQNQRQRQKIQAQESRDRLKTLQMRQRDEASKDEQDSKNQIQTRKLEKQDGVQNVSLYKTKSKTVAPVPMK